MKRIVPFFLATVLIMSNCWLGSASASAIDALDDANEYIFEKIFKGQANRNYYSEIAGSMQLRPNAIITTSEYPVFVYGDNVKASEKMIENMNTNEYYKYVKGQKVHRALGYTKEGSIFPNTNFPSDKDFSDSTRIDKLTYIEKPWNSNSAFIQGILDHKKSKFNTDDLSLYGNATFFREHIAFGIGIEYGIMRDSRYSNDFRWDNLDKEHLELCRDILNNQKNYPIGLLSKKISGDPWEVRANITQPPTDKTWGLATFFHRSGGLWYFTVPIPPTEILTRANDLEARFTTVIDAAPTGTEIKIGVLVASSFDKTIPKVDFAAVVRDNVTNKFIEATLIEKPSKLIEHDDENIFRGYVEDLVPDKDRVFEIVFEMPENEVTVQFIVNDDQDPIEEENTENNIAEMTIEAKLPGEGTKGDVTLDYYMLSKDIYYPINGGNPNSFDLGSPSTDWDGDASGSLDVTTTDEHNILGNKEITNNPRVTGDVESGSRSPVLEGTILRESSGDKPLEKQYKFDNFQNPLFQVVSDYSGTVTRPMKIYVSDSEGGGHWESNGNAEAFFTTGSDTLTIQVNIYNGMKTVPKRDLKTEIDQGSAGGTSDLNNLGKGTYSKHLEWPSDPYEYSVLHYMSHADAVGDDKSWDQVPGRYQRIFVAQNEADITYSVVSDMKEIYKTDRENAGKRVVGAKYYPWVPFATDRDLQKFPYPFKSGYYFNPTGVYQATVKTIIYSPDENDVKYHTALVDAVANSFKYESNLGYVQNQNSSRGEKLELSEASPEAFGKKLLTVDKPLGTSEAEEIRHSSKKDNTSTDTLWKYSLEGYEESYTGDSFGKYKYKEYVDDSAKMYRITQTTTITFTVNDQTNPIKVITSARMLNGEYDIKACFETVAEIEGIKDVDAVKALGNYSLDAVDPIDGMTVKVHGSMYDDIN